MKKRFCQFLCAALLLSPLLYAVDDNHRELNESLLRSVKELKPTESRFISNEHGGIVWSCLLLRKHTYKLVLDLPANISAEDATAKIGPIKKFIAEAESDTHSRLILENNTSGLPALISVDSGGPAVRYQIHHPFHDIIFNPAERSWTYTYAGPLSTFERLPEIKRVIGDKSVADFIAIAPAPLRVMATGSARTGFEILLMSADEKKIRVKLEGKTVKTLTD